MKRRKSEERDTGSDMTDTIHFEHAPLDEVVCGVRFEGVEWSDIHFGLFYAELNGRYPQTQRRAPLPPFVFDPIQPGAVQVTWTTEPDLPLLWYESPVSPFLLQVQKDAFLVNWRRQSGQYTYPHFRTRAGGPSGVWDQFLAEWQLFRTFCQIRNIGRPQVLACHLAYINHIVQGDGWDKPIDLSRWFHFLAALKSFESPAAVSMSIRYRVQELTINLNVRPGIRTTDQKSLYIIDSVAAEKLSSQDTLEAWFDRAHAAIVRQFVDQTTEEAHEKWGLSHAS
jgi:uncharacterized protein (TIGR04255 family)